MVKSIINRTSLGLFRQVEKKLGFLLNLTEKASDVPIVELLEVYWACALTMTLGNVVHFTDGKIIRMVRCENITY